MRRLSREELTALARHTHDPCVSIYMPAPQGFDHKSENRIRFKTLLSQAEEALGPEADFLDQARALRNDESFWGRMKGGFALLVAPGEFRYYRVPWPFPELSRVGSRFHIKPLLPLVAAEGPFHLLAASQNDIRLFEVTRLEMAELDLGDTPTSLEQALGLDDPEAQLQFHTGASAPQGTRGGDRPAVFHGQGTEKDWDKTAIVRFFRAVDPGLRQAMADTRAPLVFAGVEYLLPLFLEATSLKNVVDTPIAGNPEEMDASALHARAWEKVAPLFAQEREDALARYHDLIGTGKASGDLMQIVPAAAEGRVETLLVPDGVQVWGSFDQDERSVEVHDQAAPEDEDLLNVAATATLDKGGDIFVLDPGRMPDNARAAAVYRW
jgi:hypothetical protein